MIPTEIIAYLVFEDDNASKECYLSKVLEMPYRLIAGDELQESFGDGDELRCVVENAYYSITDAIYTVDLKAIEVTRPTHYEHTRNALKDAGWVLYLEPLC